MSVWIFACFVGLYFLLHSLLAANKVKAALIRSLIPEKLYRIFYNVLAAGLLIPLVWCYFLVEKRTLINAGWLVWPGLLLILAGCAWGWKSIQAYDMNEFLGTLYLKRKQPAAPSKLVVRGVNAIVRHPLYLGTLWIIWGGFLCFPNNVALSVALLSTTYIFIGIKLEEKKLEQQFGADYRSYQKEVPMLFPFSWWRKKI